MTSAEQNELAQLGLWLSNAQLHGYPSFEEYRNNYVRYVSLADQFQQDQFRIQYAEAIGYKRHTEKGNPNAQEWWSPDGKFCLFEDLPEIASP